MPEGSGSEQNRNRKKLVSEPDPDRKEIRIQRKCGSKEDMGFKKIQFRRETAVISAGQSSVFV
jgi:hypothetical protein